MDAHWPLDSPCYYLATDRRLCFVLPWHDYYCDRVFFEIIHDKLVVNAFGKITNHVSEFGIKNQEYVDNHLCRCTGNHYINLRIYRRLDTAPIEKMIQQLPMTIADEILSAFRLSVCAAVKLLYFR